MTVAEKEITLSAVDKLFIIKGLETLKNQSIIESSDIDNIILKVNQVNRLK